MPNNNNFGLEFESDGSVFCACDDMRGVEVDAVLELSGDGFDGLGLEGITRGFGL
jgi:hypothetical protein